MKDIWSRFLAPSSLSPSPSPSPSPSSLVEGGGEGGKGGNNILRDFVSFCAFVLRDCQTDQSGIFLFISLF